MPKKRKEATFGVHPWELEPCAAHSWEDAPETWQSPGSEGGEGGSDGEPTLAEVAAAASADFLELLLCLYFKSSLTAESLCVLCWYGHLGGLKGLTEWALKPGSSTGHCQRHLDKHLGVKGSGEMYSLEVGGMRKHDLARSTYTMPVKVPHESLCKEWDKDPTLGLKVAEAKEFGELPRCYTENPVVLRNVAALVVPLAMFLDGIAYSLTDNVVAVWVVNAMSGCRHLVALVRKRLTCRCGCKGWCTFFPIFLFLRWSLECLAEGVFPVTRHDGSPWLPGTDDVRAALGGRAMKFKACLAWLKGDWAEICKWGFPTWQSGLRPCFCCNAFGDLLYDIAAGPGLPTEWVLNTDESFETACARCEFWVTLDAASHADVVDATFYDKRQGGSHGRALNQDFPALGLCKGDRLEPSACLLDIGAGFDNLDFSLGQTHRVLFWRPVRETVCQHRNPLFDRHSGTTLGITPVRSVAIDMLHTFYLGILHAFCSFLVWECLRARIWGDLGNELPNTILRMRIDLFFFYKEYRDAGSGHPLTELVDLTPNMLGTETSPDLKTKGAETWGFHLFLIWVLGRHVGRLGARGPLLLQTAKALERLPLIFREADAVPSADHLQD